jgi:hypothetical protein
MSQAIMCKKRGKIVTTIIIKKNDFGIRIVFISFHINVNNKDKGKRMWVTYNGSVILFKKYGDCVFK